MKREKIENDFFDFDDEDEFDAPLGASNGRKTLVPLFVREILMDNSNSRKHFRQEEILERLDEYPYSICIERKALSRTINTLAQEFPYICKDSNGSVWFDAKKKAA